MAASSSALIFPSAATLASAKPRVAALALGFQSSSLLCFASSFPLKALAGFGRSWGCKNSPLVRNVAVSSDFGLEQEEDAGEEVSFSPDLKLFVGNLPFNVDSGELAGLFGQVGTVEMVEVIYDKLTGRSRGFGFVTMSTVDEVEAATQQFNGYELEGRSLRVNSGPPPPKDEFSPRGFRSGGNSSPGFRSGGNSGPSSGNRVYVGNLSWGVDDSALESMFSEQGKVLEAKVVYDRESGRSRGFGFVTYSSPQEVNRAISSLNGADLDGRSIRVTEAESRDSRPRRQF